MMILEMSLGGGVLIAVILVLRRALLYRVPKWTFLLLWAAALCRLMIPLAVPSPVSVYSGAAWIAASLRPVQTPALPAETDIPPVILPESPVSVPGTLRQDDWRPAEPVPAAPEREPVSPVAAVYVTGAALCALFFGAAYLWNLRRFWDAVPAEEEFLFRWQRAHPTPLPVQIKVSRAVNTPLAYGLLRPVILLPADTDWSDEDQLTYILTHEYVHIRRGDLLWKLLLTAALCVHWCNPLVWAMYFCANRDLELACDELVVRTLGLDSRKGYAYALLSAAESGFFPLCTTYTTKNHMEERIRAIMKMKKKSLAAVLTALLLVAGVTAVFATSKAPPDADKQPPAAQTGQENNANPVLKPTPGNKSDPDDHVHPATPADTSTPDDRVPPVTDQPLAGDAAQEPDTTPVESAHRPGKATAYPVNSKGHTYGVWTEADGYDDVPDLIYVRWDSTTEGYLNRNEVYPYSWPIGPNSTQEELQRYLDWYHKLTKNDKPDTDYVPYCSAGFSMYDREETGSIGGCAGFEAHARPDGHKLSDEALLELVAQGNPVKWSLFLGTAPIENIPDSSNQPFREVPKTEEEWALLEKWTENGDWRKNSKGQTYGPYGLGYYVGYFPDLICRTASNGEAGYERIEDHFNIGYPYGDISNPDALVSYYDWLKTQPSVIKIPVYDLEMTRIIGYTEIQNDRSDKYEWSAEEIEKRLRTLEDEFREWGWSEEQIAKELENYKKDQGWS